MFLARAERAVSKDGVWKPSRPLAMGTETPSTRFLCGVVGIDWVGLENAISCTSASSFFFLLFPDFSNKPFWRVRRRDRKVGMYTERVELCCLLIRITIEQEEKQTPLRKSRGVGDSLSLTSRTKKKNAGRLRNFFLRLARCNSRPAATNLGICVGSVLTRLDQLKSLIVIVA